MALIISDRVRETTSTAGTGTVTLDGAVTGYQSFSAIGNGNTTYYCIAGQGTTEWEVGIGTYTSAGTTLSRDTVLSSSNSGSKVVFSAGTKDVFVTYPSGRSVNLDASGNVSALGTIASGTWQGTTVGVAYGGTGVTSSSGANSVVLRDANSNITGNNFLGGYNVITAAAVTHRPLEHVDVVLAPYLGPEASHTGCVWAGTHTRSTVSEDANRFRSPSCVML